MVDVPEGQRIAREDEAGGKAAKALGPDRA